MTPYERAMRDQEDHREMKKSGLITVGGTVSYDVEPSGSELLFYCDDARHLICVPYNTQNLHKMAEMLNIKRCWFHAGTLAHYDIPKQRIDEITEKCHVVTTRRLIEIMKAGLQIHDPQPFFKLRARLREQTPPGLPIPRLTLTDTIFCEIIGDLTKRIAELEARLDMATQSGSFKK